MILTESPTSYRLWTHYITFRQSNFASFSVPGILDVFEDCLDSMSTGIKKLDGRHKIERERDLIRIFGRLTRFLAQSGTFLWHIERWMCSQMKHYSKATRKKRLHCIKL